VFVCVLLGEEREMEKVHKMCELTENKPIEINPLPLLNPPKTTTSNNKRV